MKGNTLSHTQRSGLIGCFALGLSIGGVFDGILLHQILQWHHLLSGIADRAADLRFQVMADGVFHAAMYILLLIGLGFLWRQRRDPDTSQFAAASAMAWTFMGFGAWHLALASWPAPCQDGQPKPVLLGPPLVGRLRSRAAVTWLAVPEGTATRTIVTSCRSGLLSVGGRHRRCRSQLASDSERGASDGIVRQRKLGKRNHASHRRCGRFRCIDGCQRTYLGRQI
ncbi:DUF2243 domain-containing protein [Sinorhizobium meliloti]|uniref:DUF2243 domain-containing protein n=1 Tax=Rhizobium meliloti TaxID=382 RepID=UPI0009B77738